MYESEVRPVLRFLNEHGTNPQEITIPSELESEMDNTSPILAYISAITGLVNSELETENRINKEIEKQEELNQIIQQKDDEIRQINQQLTLFKEALEQSKSPVYILLIFIYLFILESKSKSKTTKKSFSITSSTSFYWR